jgi:hypothetical protein
MFNCKCTLGRGMSCRALFRERNARLRKTREQFAYANCMYHRHREHALPRQWSNAQTPTTNTLARSSNHHTLCCIHHFRATITFLSPHCANSINHCSAPVQKYPIIYPILPMQHYASWRARQWGQIVAALPPSLSKRVRIQITTEPGWSSSTWSLKRSVCRFLIIWPTKKAE